MLLKAVLVVAVLLLVAAGDVNAQSVQRFKIDVPFSFVLNKLTLPAGKYVIERTDPARPNIVTLKKIDGRIVRLIQTQRVEKNEPSTASSLVFIRRKATHYLFQVWNFGAMNGGQVPSAPDKKSTNQQPGDIAFVTVRARGH